MRRVLALSLVAALFLRLAAWRAGVDRAHRLCAPLEAGMKGLSFPEITGSLLPLSGSRWELGDPVLAWRGERFALTGPVRLADSVVGARPRNGEAVTVSGPFRCRIVARNPGRLADGFLFLEPPVLSVGERHARVVSSGAPAAWSARFAVALGDWLGGPFARAPGIRGLVRAVWLGDTSGLPEPLVTSYREGGLLPILALSGQHVTVLAFLLGAFLSGAIRFACRARAWRPLAFVFRETRRLLPVVCAGFLYVASSGSPSMRRTLAMCLACFALRLRCLACGPLQLTASSVALAIALDPGALASPGFLLSAAATAMLVQIAAEGDPRRGLSEYVFLSVAMAVVTLPLSAFFFAKVAWSAPLNTLLLGWAWSLVLMPAAFLLPFAARLVPDAWAAHGLATLDVAWRTFCDLHLHADGWIAFAYRTAVRPTWIEVVAWESALLGVVLYARRRILPASEASHAGSHSPLLDSIG